MDRSTLPAELLQPKSYTDGQPKIRESVRKLRERGNLTSKEWDQLYLNSYESCELIPVLTDEALVEWTSKAMLPNCSRHSRSTYDGVRMFLQLKPRTDTSLDQRFEAAMTVLSGMPCRVPALASEGGLWQWIGRAAFKLHQTGPSRYEEFQDWWERLPKLTLICGPHGHGKDAFADLLYPSGGEMRGVPTSKLLIEFVAEHEILKQSPNDPWYGLTVEEIYARRHERSQWLNQIGRSLRVSSPGFIVNQLITKASRTAVGIRDISELRTALPLAEQIVWVHRPSRSEYDPTLEYGLATLLGEANQSSASVLVYYNDGSLSDMKTDITKALGDGVITSSDPAYADILPTNSPNNAT